MFTVIVLAMLALSLTKLVHSTMKTPVDAGVWPTGWNPLLPPPAPVQCVDCFYPVTGLQMICVLPVGHSGYHDYRGSFREGETLNAYIEILGSVYWYGRVELHELDLELITRTFRKFTRESVQGYLEGLLIDLCNDLVDFHAVCGDIDIPWAKAESQKIFEDAELRHKSVK